jgi:23S rRNA G2445 N2-methylase RlmL
LQTIQFNPEELEFHASCGEGLIDFLLEELKQYNLKVQSSNRGGVFFIGNKNQLQNFILNTRFSSRIGFSISKMNVESPDELYKKASQLPWEKILPYKASFKIDSFTKDSLNHSRYALYKLKDAIRDRLREKNREDVTIERDLPDIVFLLRSNQNFVNIQISITNDSLFKRGYRLESVEAPLKETLAQALLYFSNWDNESIIIDPMCGSGTILIEAAMLLSNKYLNYSLLSKSKVYPMLFREIEPKYSNDSENILLYGYDKNPKAIEIAKTNAKRAGVANKIEFKEQDISKLKKFTNTGYIITNPPYGQRMGDEEEVKILYKEFGEVLKREFSNYKVTLICGNKSLLGQLKLKEENSLNISVAKLKAKIVNYKIQ